MNPLDIMLPLIVVLFVGLPFSIWLGVRHRNKSCDLCRSTRYVRKLRNGGRLCAGCREALESL